MANPNWESLREFNKIKISTPNDLSMTGTDHTGSLSPGLPAPGDSIVQRRNEAIQAATQPTADGGMLSQLTSNPFFTAVRTAKKRVCQVIG